MLAAAPTGPLRQTFAGINTSPAEGHYGERLGDRISSKVYASNILRTRGNVNLT